MSIPLRYVGLLLAAGHSAFAMNACPVGIWPVSEDVNDGQPLFHSRIRLMMEKRVPAV
jgi:hypothetical protein